MEQFGSHWTDFHGIWCLNNFFPLKSVQEIQVLLKSDKNNGCFTRIPMYIYDNCLLPSGDNPTAVNKYIIISRWILFVMRNVLRKIVEKINTHILCSIAFFWKSCRLWDNVEKYGRAGQNTDDNMALALAGYLGQQMHIQNVKCLLLSHRNNGCTFAPQCHAVRTVACFVKECSWCWSSKG